MSNPKIKFIVTPPPDATVENSDASYTDTVASGDTLVVPDINIEVNTVVEGTIPAIKDVKILITDGVNPVTPDDVSVVGDTVTVEVPSGGGTFDVDLVDRFGNAFPTKQVTANATWDLRTLTPFDFADLYLNTLSVTPTLTFENAIIDLVDDLSTSGVWQKKHAIWVLCAGNSFDTALNLKYPFANKSSFQLNHIGSPTFASDGILYNRTTQHSVTQYNPSIFSQQDLSMSVYSQTNGAVTGPGVDIGIFSTGTIAQITIKDDSATRCVGAAFGGLTIGTNTGNADGYFQLNAQTNFKIVRHGVTLLTGSTGSTVGATDVYINGRNNNGTNEFRAGRKYSLSAVGLGLTDTQIADEFTAIQTFHTTLGIQK
jgi:hypothetical protein